jgi:hypothetical protein
MIDFHESCEILFPSKKDSYGKLTFLPPNETKCRVKEKYQKIKNQSAELVDSEIEFWFSSDTPINTDCTIKLNNKSYPVISIKLSKNTFGEETKKVVFV